MNLDSLLFPDNYAGDKKYMQQQGYGRPTVGGPFSFWLSDAREQDRENSLGGAMGGISQIMKYIIMMRGGLKHQNGGAPGYDPNKPAATRQGVQNMSGGSFQSANEAQNWQRMLQAIAAMQASPTSYGAANPTGYGYGE